jgi:hypothetical protein
MVGPMLITICQLLYSIRPIGDIEDSVLYLPYFGAFYGQSNYIINAVGS